MKKGLLIKNATMGYSVAALSVLIAGMLFILDWSVMGSAFAAFGICLAVDVASKHGHLSKKNGGDDKVS